MHLTCLLVLFKINELFEGVQLLVKLTPDLDLGSQEVQLVSFLHLDVLIVTIASRDSCFDQTSVSL